MPLIEDEPPSPLPRGQCMRRWSRNGSGSDSKNQLKRGMFMGIDRAVGIWTRMWRSEPPASSSSTRTSGSWLSWSASTQPAEPAPTMM